jgi:hypothetical protein
MQLVPQDVNVTLSLGLQQALKVIVHSFKNIFRPEKYLSGF